MRIFGHLWDAPVCDGQTPEPPPLGQRCLNCDEVIGEEDSGFIMACLHAEGVLDWRPQHRECSLLNVIGHSFGYCGCTGYRGMSEREAGLMLWAEVQKTYGSP